MGHFLSFFCGQQLPQLPGLQKLQKLRPGQEAPKGTFSPGDCNLVVGNYCKVVPQFGIAKLVQISPMVLGFMEVISIVNGDYYKPTNITEGYHLVGKLTGINLPMG